MKLSSAVQALLYYQTVFLSNGVNGRDQRVFRGGKLRREGAKRERGLTSGKAPRGLGGKSKSKGGSSISTTTMGPTTTTMGPTTTTMGPTTTTMGSTPMTTIGSTPAACFDCTSNNPCTQANIDAENFYFNACTGADYYTQCDASKTCFTKPCGANTVWVQALLTCAGDA